MVQVRCSYLVTYQGQVWTIFQPYLAQLYFKASQKSDFVKAESIGCMRHSLGVSFSALCQGLFWTMLGPCLSQISFEVSQCYQMFRCGPQRYTGHNHGMYNSYDHARAIFGPCLDQLYFQATQSFEILKLHQLSPRDISMEFDTLEPC